MEYLNTWMAGFIAVFFLPFINLIFILIFIPICWILSVVLHEYAHFIVANSVKGDFYVATPKFIVIDSFPYLIGGFVDINIKQIYHHNLFLIYVFGPIVNYFLVALAVHAIYNEYILFPFWISLFIVNIFCLSISWTNENGDLKKINEMFNNSLRKLRNEPK